MIEVPPTDIKLDVPEFKPAFAGQTRAPGLKSEFPIDVSVVAKDAKYKADGTDMGFKPVKVFSAEEAAMPAQPSCKMQRPS